ncbi:MAG: methylmalonyl Co-A mutase-associated GTPase MeaB [Bacteroidota bacterium]
MARRQAKRLSLSEYLDGIRAGNRMMLSKAITLVESRLASDRKLANELIEACLPFTGQSYRLGITGVPGVGKSTLIDTFGFRLAEQGHKVAVLAIDPSSQLSKGSILGDKTRMHQLAHHPAAYVRPSPTAGSLGGVARQTRETLLLCEAAGYDTIIVETVGVGQSETAVHGMVDFFLLLALPNAGDDLQGIKKGVMEMADALLINKADGPFLPKARQAKANYSQAMRLFPQKESNWKPQIHLVSALENTGLDQVQQMLETYRSSMEQNGFWQKRRSQQAQQWMYDAIRQGLEDQFFNHPAIRERLVELQQLVLEQKRAPIQVAEELLQAWRDQ